MKTFIILWAVLFSTLVQAYPFGVKGAGQPTATFPSVLDFGDQIITTTGGTAKFKSSAPKNYITASDGAKIGSWVTYADAAGTNPVDGTGGSPASTFAVSTDSSLRGTTNFLWTHTAANRQGEGFSYAFTIDPMDTGKVLRIDMDYMVNSGTYADDDLQFWIYDVTNSALIQPAPYKLKNTTIKDHLAMEFQTSTATSYRLIGHVATSTATAYTLRFTNFSIAGGLKVYAAGEVTYTAKVSSAGVVSDENIDFINGSCVVTSTSISTCTFNTGVFTVAPTCVVTSEIEQSVVKITTSSTAFVTKTNDSSTGTAVAKNYQVACYKTGADYTNATSGKVSSSQADTRIIAAKMYLNADTAVTALNPIPFTTIVYDTHGALTTGASAKYTAPISGYYRIGLFYDVTTNNQSAFLYKNGVNQGIIGSVFSGVGGTSVWSYFPLQLVAGDTVDIRPMNSVTAKGNTVAATTVSTTRCEMSIERVTGPSQIAASETVAASYYMSANSSVSTLLPFNYDTKVYDSHNAVTTGSGWKFTAPIAGIYTVIYTPSLTTNSGIKTFVYKNGASYAVVGYNNGQGEAQPHTYKVKLLAGEYIDIRPNASLTALGGTQNAASVTAWIAIERTGNY